MIDKITKKKIKGKKNSHNIQKPVVQLLNILNMVSCTSFFQNKDTKMSAFKKIVDFELRSLKQYPMGNLL